MYKRQTPILRHQLVGTDGPDADLLQAMQSAVRHKWSSFADDCGLTAEGETVNDRFFAYQREAFERGDAPFLELEGSKAEREAYETLRSAWLENAREYVAIVASEEAAADMFDDLDALLAAGCWRVRGDAATAYVLFTGANHIETVVVFDRVDMSDLV